MNIFLSLLRLVLSPSLLCDIVSVVDASAAHRKDDGDCAFIGVVAVVAFAVVLRSLDGGERGSVVVGGGVDLRLVGVPPAAAAAAAVEEGEEIDEELTNDGGHWKEFINVDNDEDEEEAAVDGVMVVGIIIAFE